MALNQRSLNFVHAKKLYEKDKNLRERDVKMLMTWVSKQHHLPEVTEIQGILFLQSCYYLMEPAKRAIDNFFTVRTIAPDLFDSTNIDAVMKTTMQSVLFSALPSLTPQGNCVFLVKLLDLNPDKCEYKSQIKLFDMVSLYHLHTHGPCQGLEVISDMEGGTLKHMSKLSISILRRALFYLQEGIPLRLKRVHLINVVPFIDKALLLVKPFMKKELLNLLKIHSGSLETFYESIPKQMMPREYGGEAPSFRELQAQVNKDLSENGEFFTNLRSQQVDENKREGAAKNESQLFGTDGSFRKLEVD